MDVITQYFAEGATRLEREGRRATAATTVTPRRDPTVPPQGFRVHYREDEVVVDHSDDEGLSAGLSVVEALDEDASFECALEVRDAPVLATRAYLMDVSGDRVLAWDGFVRVVEILERLRFNQLELRVGHAFAYRGEDAVWEGTSPLTPAQLRRVEALCASHGIRLVTAIEPLTHWERWLALPEYAARAELPEGRTDEEGHHVPPSELAASPANAHFVAGLVQQLTDALSTRRINIGGHSTRELGLGASKALVARHGLAAVYLDFIEHATVALGPSDMVGEMWADLVALDPSLLEKVPSHVTPIVRCSEPADPSRGTGGFAVAGEALAGVHRPFWVAPGTGTWNTFCGRTTRALANVADAVDWGVTNGASGMLLTSWAGKGHWAPEVLNLPAMVEAAVRGWRGVGPGEDLHRLLDALIPDDIVAAILSLGDVAEVAPVPLRNTDITWEALRRGGNLPASWGIRAEQCDSARDVVQEAGLLLSTSRGGTGAIPRAQVRLCVDMCAFGLTLVEVAQGRSRASSVDLSGLWEELVARQRRLWLATAREGGLEHSLAFLDPVARAGVPA